MVSEIKVISFDLDDALYDNQPVLQNAEHRCNEFLEKQFNRQNIQFSLEAFYSIRHRLMSSVDHAMENMTLMRQVAIREFCVNLEEADLITQQALAIFLQARSQATVPSKIFSMMEILASRYLLVSVTNGNCDPGQLSIGKFFHKNYSPVEGYRAKPHPQMLLQVIEDFKLDKSELLHIGDSLDKDGLAAKKAGVNYFHFAPFIDGNTPAGVVSQFEEFLSSFVSNNN